MGPHGFSSLCGVSVLHPFVLFAISEVGESTLSAALAQQKSVAGSRGVRGQSPKSLRRGHYGEGPGSGPPQQPINPSGIKTAEISLQAGWLGVEDSPGPAWSFVSG